MEIPVAQGAGGLPVIRLGRLDAPQSGAAPLHIDDEAGQVAPRYVRDALCFEGDAGGRRGGHGPYPGGGRPQHHVNGGNLRFRLEVGPADFRHLFGHIGRHFGLGGDGVAEEVAAAGADGRLRHRFVSLHQNAL